MKKWIALIMVITTVFLFAACTGDTSVGESKVKKVPDAYLKLDVEDYIYENEISDSYTFTSVHNYDADSGLDQVTIEIRVAHLYADEVITGTCAYRYNKSDDTWSKAQTVRWGEMSLEYKPNKFLKTFENRYPIIEGSSKFIEFEITVQELNLEAGTIMCQYYALSVQSKVCEARGSGTFSLDRTGSGEYVFTIPGDKGEFSVWLYADTGIHVYMWDY